MTRRRYGPLINTSAFHPRCNGFEFRSSLKISYISKPPIIDFVPPVSGVTRHIGVLVPAWVTVGAGAILIGGQCYGGAPCSVERR